MKKILILLCLATFFSCGLSEEEKKKLDDEGIAKKTAPTCNFLRVSAQMLGGQ